MLGVYRNEMTVSKERFRDMTYHEKLKLKMEQPTVYKQLVASLLGGK